MSVVCRRRCACDSATWTAVVLFVLCSAVVGSLDENGGWPVAEDVGDASNQFIYARESRSIDDNDISQEMDTADLKPGDLDIVSDKLSIYKVIDGDDKSAEDETLASGSADLMGTKDAAGQQNIVYSYPYVVFRRLADGKKEAAYEDAIYKDGSSYTVSESPDGNSEQREDDASETLNAMKLAFAIAKQLLTVSSELHKSVGSSPWESRNFGTFLNGLFAGYRSPVAEYWSPWEREGPSEPSVGVFNIDKVLESMISDVLKAAVVRKPSRISSVSAWCPRNRRGHLSAAQSAMRLMSPELLWLVTRVPPIL